EFGVATFAWTNRVRSDAGLSAGRRVDFELRRASAKCGRYVFDKLGRNHDRAGVLQLQCDFGFHVELWWDAPEAIDTKLGGRGEASQLPEPRSSYCELPEAHQVEDPAIIPRGPEPH